MGRMVEVGLCLFVQYLSETNRTGGRDRGIYEQFLCFFPVQDVSLLQLDPSCFSLNFPWLSSECFASRRLL